LVTVTRRVSVERNRLRFAAAHMATFHGDLEPLHGHNYDVIVEIDGELTDDAWVWDFGDLKRTAKAIVDELDHKFLLQAESSLLDIEEGARDWTIRFNHRRYVFPREDVVALPVANTTAELLAEWIAGRLVQELHGREGARFRRMAVGVEEMPGQAGWYTVDLEG
jgi:6-pyruvoyltetrahydropterin/6-carboxytetrahydropterin synthase